MKDYRQLEVWQRSHRLTLAVYAASKSFPKEEREYFRLLAADLGLLSPTQHGPLADEIAQLKKMLGALARKLKADR